MDPEKHFLTWIEGRMGMPFNPKNNTHGILRTAYLQAFAAAIIECDSLKEELQESSYLKGYNQGFRDALSAYDRENQ